VVAADLGIPEFCPGEQPLNYHDKYHLPPGSKKWKKIAKKNGTEAESNDRPVSINIMLSIT